MLVPIGQSLYKDTCLSDIDSLLVVTDSTHARTVCYRKNVSRKRQASLSERLHLHNYFNINRNTVRMKKKTQCFFGLLEAALIVKSGKCQTAKLEPTNSGLKHVYVYSLRTQCVV